MTQNQSNPSVHKFGAAPKRFRTGEAECCKNTAADDSTDSDRERSEEAEFILVFLTRY